MKTIVSEHNLKDLGFGSVVFITDSTDADEICYLIKQWFINKNRNVEQCSWSETNFTNITLEKYKFTSYDYILEMENRKFHFECNIKEELNIDSNYKIQTPKEDN